MGTAFGIVFVILAIVILVFAERERRRIHRSHSWPSVRGLVVKAKVLSIDDDSPIEVPNDATIFAPSPGRPFWLDFLYQYEIGGRVLTSSRVSFTTHATSFKSPGPAQAVVAQYPAGTEVIAYYNPSHPEFSVLERGPILQVYVSWGFAVILLLLAGIGIFANGSAELLMILAVASIVVIAGGAGLALLRRHPPRNAV